MINSVVLMGRLTKDPELRTTTNGLSVTTFSIAVDRNYVQQGQDRKADFINIVAWRSTAEFITRYFRKGNLIALQGHIQVRPYEDRNGNKRTAFEVVADQVSFCGSKNEEGSKSKPAEYPVEKPVSNAGPDDFSSVELDDELPF